MAAIFEAVVIRYAGKDYTVKPTFEMINRIEMPRAAGGLGISLAGLTARSSRGDVPVSEVARIISYMLRSVGAPATDEDVYVEIMTTEDASAYIEAVTTAFFPIVRPISPSEGNKKK